MSSTLQRYDPTRQSPSTTPTPGSIADYTLWPCAKSTNFQHPVRVGSCASLALPSRVCFCRTRTPYGCTSALSHHVGRNGRYSCRFCCRIRLVASDRPQFRCSAIGGSASHPKDLSGCNTLHICSTGLLITGEQALLFFGEVFAGIFLAFRIRPRST